MNTKQNHFEYTCLVVIILKRLLEAKLISYADFDEIDRLNKGRFLCKQNMNPEDNPQKKH